ncbi:HtaA domain-containing protein [Rhodococcus opacus]|uniref:HtaA domain-containing protein n=1 Tax=Rhodococcus opacus TaxID=37919 RepID=UPI00155AF054|nr:HtaA domain-containing protein [Rhodococcus opacus]
MTAGGGPCALPRVGLTWGIKRSFIRYIATLPDGRHAMSEGAYLGETSYFTFPPVPSPDAPQVVRFGGDVRLGGHGGMLDILIAEPWVEMTESGPILSVVDPTGWPDRSRRIPLAELHLREAEHGLTARRYAATLTGAGSVIFDDHYPPGTELDTLVIE